MADRFGFDEIVHGAGSVGDLLLVTNVYALRTTTAGTVLDNYTPGAESTHLLRVYATARRDDGTEGASFGKAAAFRVNAGTLAQIGATQSIFTAVTDIGAATWNIGIQVSGGSIQVTVTGEAGKTIDWMFQVIRMEHSNLPAV